MAFLMRLFPSVFARLDRWLAYRAAKAELMQLDDQTLGELGFTRGEIDDVARRAAAAPTRRFA